MIIHTPIALRSKFSQRRYASCATDRRRSPGDPGQLTSWFSGREANFLRRFSEYEFTTLNEAGAVIEGSRNYCNSFPSHQSFVDRASQEFARAYKQPKPALISGITPPQSHAERVERTAEPQNKRITCPESAGSLSGSRQVDHARRLDYNRSVGHGARR